MNDSENQKIEARTYLRGYHHGVTGECRPIGAPRSYHAGFDRGQNDKLHAEVFAREHYPRPPQDVQAIVAEGIARVEREGASDRDGVPQATPAVRVTL